MENKKQLNEMELDNVTAGTYILDPQICAEIGIAKIQFENMYEPLRHFAPRMADVTKTLAKNCELLMNNYDNEEIKATAIRDIDVHCSILINSGSVPDDFKTVLQMIRDRLFSAIGI